MRLCQIALCCRGRHRDRYKAIAIESELGERRHVDVFDEQVDEPVGKHGGHLTWLVDAAR